MRIILNSDILYTTRPLATGLPDHLARFCREAGSAGAVLVLPLTTLLECERREQELTEEAIKEIDEAADVLRSWGVELPAVDAQKLVHKGDLVAMLRATGIAVEVEKPILDDYREAERRACLHLPPQPPDTESDEMRDLVIWEVALRLARKDGKAILVSRDKVHSHERGAAEAEACHLLRVTSLDDALELMGRESPSGALARSILATVWDDLRANGLPLGVEPAVRRVNNLSFVSDDEGRAGGRLGFVVDVADGQLSGTANVRQINADRIQVEVKDLRLNKCPWQREERRWTPLSRHSEGPF